MDFIPKTEYGSNKRKEQQTSLPDFKVSCVRSEDKWVESDSPSQLQVDGTHGEANSDQQQIACYRLHKTIN